MTEKLKTWWRGHSPAERGIIAAIAIAILLVILWLGVWRPVNDGLASGWTKQGAALDRLGSVRSKVAALKRAPDSAQASGSLPVEQLVSQTAAEAGFTLDRVGNQGEGRMSVSIASARTGPLLGWLAQIEGAGVAIQTISIVPGAVDGTVSMQAVFQDRAR